MLLLLILTISPIIAILMFIYYEDKYEKEPLIMLIKAYFIGFLAVLIAFGVYKLFPNKFFDYTQSTVIKFLQNLVIAITEEASKIVLFIIFIWSNRNFNEKYDGILYSVFIGLGFATIENFQYIFFSDHPYYTAILRGITSVPAHGVFGVISGYYLAKAKFDKKIFFVHSIILSVLAHFLYDFIIDITQKIFVVFFMYLFFLVLISWLMIKKHSDSSFFKP